MLAALKTPITASTFQITKNIRLIIMRVGLSRKIIVDAFNNIFPPTKNPQNVNANPLCPCQKPNDEELCCELTFFFKFFDVFFFNLSSNIFYVF